jgi:hypothetical protein
VARAATAEQLAWPAPVVPVWLRTVRTARTATAVPVVLEDPAALVPTEQMQRRHPPVRQAPLAALAALAATAVRQRSATVVSAA